MYIGQLHQWQCFPVTVYTLITSQVSKQQCNIYSGVAVVLFGSVWAKIIWQSCIKRSDRKQKEFTNTRAIVPSVVLQFSFNPNGRF